MLRNRLGKNRVFFCVCVCLTFAKIDQKVSLKAFSFDHLLTQDITSLGNLERHRQGDRTVLNEAVTPSPGLLKFPVCDKMRQAEIFLSVLQMSIYLYFPLMEQA